jgi:hypothetical protein
MHAIISAAIDPTFVSQVSSMPDHLQYISDAQGNTVSVIVSIELWREIETERETAYLLRSPTMKARLIEAKERSEGTSLEEARAKLGI